MPTITKFNGTALMHMTSFTGVTSLAASEEHINTQEYVEEVLCQHRVKIDE